MKNVNRCTYQNVAGTVMVKLNKFDQLVVSTLKTAEKGMTLKEIAEKTGQTEKKIFKVLRKLFENEIIETEAHQYRLVKT